MFQMFKEEIKCLMKEILYSMKEKAILAAVKNQGLMAQTIAALPEVIQ